MILSHANLAYNCTLIKAASHPATYLLFLNLFLPFLFTVLALFLDAERFGRERERDRDRDERAAPPVVVAGILY